MASATTTYARAVDRLLKAALDAAEHELGGELTDWRTSFEGPAHVVVKAWRGERSGTFAGQLDARDHSVRTTSHGTGSSEQTGAARRFSRD